MSFIELLKVILLGIVEGITEWLPISSTGHMILVDEFIKLNVSDAFMEFFLVIIQLGAIMAVVVLYWSKLWPFYIRKIPKKTQMALRKQPAVSRAILTFVEKYCDKEKWILWFKILVACLPTIIIAATTSISNAIMTESSLSFLGIGIQEPLSSWGKLLQSAQSNLQNAVYMAIIPGLLIMLTIFAFNKLGNLLRIYVDPRVMDAGK